MNFTFLVEVCVCALVLFALYLKNTENEPLYAAADAPLASAAQRVANASTLAAVPAPPRFEPLDELMPQRLAEPVFVGCAPTFVDEECDFYMEAPRLWETDLDRLMWERALRQGQENMIEPLEARQKWIQLLTLDTRSKKDKYTRATIANDVGRGVCRELAERTPSYTSF